MLMVVENGSIWLEILLMIQIKAVYKMGEKPPIK